MPTELSELANLSPTRPDLPVRRGRPGGGGRSKIIFILRTEEIDIMTSSHIPSLYMPTNISIIATQVDSEAPFMHTLATHNSWTNYCSLQCGELYTYGQFKPHTCTTIFYIIIHDMHSPIPDIRICPLQSSKTFTYSLNFPGFKLSVTPRAAMMSLRTDS